MTPRLSATLICLAVLLPALATAAAPTRPLRVLLTNDDGYLAPGIQAEYTALRAAGFEVTLVAPRDNQSGSSVRISTTPLTYREESAGVWAVDGSPADAAAVGLKVVMKDNPPDVVVSGANLGQNGGRTANISGTVGAAILSARLGVSAVAVSVGIDLAEAGAKPKPFPTTFATFARASEFTVSLLRRLMSHRNAAGVLPPATVLNINYPVSDGGHPKGVRYARHSARDAYGFEYVATGRPNEVKLALGAPTEPELDPAHADTALFRAGYVTVTVLDGDWEAPARQRADVLARLSPLPAP